MREDGERVIVDRLSVQFAFLLLKDEQAEVHHHPAAVRVHFRGVPILVLEVYLLKDDFLEPAGDSATSPAAPSEASERSGRGGSESEADKRAKYRQPHLMSSHKRMIILLPMRPSSVSSIKGGVDTGTSRSHSGP